MGLLLKILQIPQSFRWRFYRIYNRIYFHASNIKLGKNAIINNKVLLTNQGSITVGNDFKLLSGDGFSPISANLCSSIAVEHEGVVRIGDDVGISSSSLRIRKGLYIGNHVRIGANCLLLDSDSHSKNYKERRDSEDIRNVISLPITIEDDVLIGTKCIILKGVTIGTRSIIGACSVVTKSIPPNSIAAGNPCKVIRKIDEDKHTTNTDLSKSNH